MIRVVVCDGSFRCSVCRDHLRGKQDKELFCVRSGELLQVFDNI